MSTSTNTPAQEQLNIQLNAENIHNNNSSPDELSHREHLTNTPFWIIGNKEHGYFLAMGNNRLTERMKTIDEVKQHFLQNTYMIITQMITIIAETIYQQHSDEIAMKINTMKQ